MSGPVTQCGLCASERLEPVLSLGSSPPTCNMRAVGSRDPETHYPLEMLRCADCTLVQLSYVADPQDVFPAGYPYSSGHSRALHENFTGLRDEALTWAGLSGDDLVVDIGANDGTLLSKFMGKTRTVGVEPTRQARRIAGPVYQEFFTEQLAQRIVAEHGPARLVTACNVLAHVDDIHDVMRGINVLLADDGVLIAENHDLQSVVNGQWDTVYHEHLRFYDPYSFAELLYLHGIGPRYWTFIRTHGGSFRMAAARDVDPHVNTPTAREYDFPTLATTVLDARTAIRAVADGGVYGIGATARATTIINYCGLDVEDLSCVCEVSGSDKIGRLVPGTRIPVVDEQRLITDQPEKALLLSWHLADVIVPKLRDRGYDGEIVVPLPTLQTA